MRATLRLPDKYAGMNKTEREWALTLEAQSRATGIMRAAPDGRHLRDLLEYPQVVLWRYESVRFVLAKGTSYLPDFWVLFSDRHLECHEVKAVHKTKQSGRSGWRTASAVKFKTAAELFPEIVWVAAEKQLDGTWTATRAEDLFKRKTG